MNFLITGIFLCTFLSVGGIGSISSLEISVYQALLFA